jgi:hypothetical protein
MITELGQALEQVARRFRRTRLWGALALCWLVWALAGIGLWLLGMRFGDAVVSPTALAALIVAAALTGIACAFLSLRSVSDKRWVARKIEARHPDLQTGLLAAIEEQESAPSGRLGYLQSAVIREALEHRRAHDWNETVPTWKLRVSQLSHAATLGCLLAVAVALAAQARRHAQGSTAYLTAAAADQVQVDPGNAEIERGTSLLVVARFRGGAPAEASLVVEGRDGKTARLAMTRSLEDPTFAGHISSVDSDLSYRVEFQDKRTDPFEVKVFEYPDVERTDAALVFPSYTALEPKTIEDIRHVTAVEGTELALSFRLNKEVAKAELIDADGQSIALANDGEARGHVYRAKMTLTDPRRFRVHLVDRDGRENKRSIEVVANVTRNRVPNVKIAQPGRDTAVSPLEEMITKAEIDDDFGVMRHGVSFSMAGGDLKEIVLPSPAAKSRKVTAQHMLDFESLKAEPDQLLTYYYWAEDIGPDGQPRRTSGDMFFAEVRPFEEIYRQGEQPPSGSAENEEQEGQQGAAQASDQLAELQKQIINGTWKLVRRESGPKPTAQLAEDGKVLEESQKQALAQAGQLGERLRDAGSKAHLEQATSAMKLALSQLGQVASGSSIPALRSALAAEQSAYQGLLKLRAREFEVIRRQRQQRQASRSGSANRSQRQLQQLELTEDENRYEDQRTARAKEQSLSQREREQREAGQVLNRLRELAQRQTDVNQRLKELQSALEAAKTQPAREEIERQLKRLREQEQQILRDTDELRERMESEENRERMADARAEVDETREHVRQASDALEQGKVSKALTEGSRAGRQLSELRDELRKRAANRFSQEMTEMREQARRLEENQKKLTEQLEAAKDRQQTSLRNSGERKQVTERLGDQRKSLEQLVNSMQTTVEAAEETEPLLAKSLYDTARAADEQKIPDAIKAAEQLSDLGVPEDAAKESQRAGAGLERLRAGIERSARSVLGDETAALKRAEGELEDLAEQVNDEIAQATGKEPSSRRAPNARTPRSGERPGAAPLDQDPEAGQDGTQPRAGEPRDSEPGNERNPQGQGPRAGQGQQRKGDPGDRDPQRAAGRQGEPGEQPARGQEGQQAGQERGQGEAQGQGEGGQEGQGQQREQGGPEQGQAGGGRGGDRRGGQPNGQRQRSGLRGGPDRVGGGNPEAPERETVGQARNGPGRPITGEGFREWSDRMRDVEELLDEPELRAEAARIRDRARTAREEFKRHSRLPDWEKLKGLVAEPISELRDRIAEEVRRRQSPDALVPIDRDPVPPQFADGVRRYYERLGSGR